jgi:DNA-binding ferritin-like protein (Dps family)
MCLPPNPDDVLGKSKAWLDTYKGKTALIASVEFEPKEINPLAEKVFQKVLFGSLNAASVGILPIGEGKVEKDVNGNKTYFYDGQELIEWSIVNIPANPDARAKALKNQTESALVFVQRLLPDFGMKDLREMKIKDILDLIERKNIPQEELEQIVGPDPNLDKLNERLTKIKNRKWTL